MKPYPFRGLNITFRISEEPPGVFWPAGDITDPATGESGPVAIEKGMRTPGDAVAEVIFEAKRRIANGTWRG